MTTIEKKKQQQQKVHNLPPDMVPGKRKWLSEKFKDITVLSLPLLIIY